MKYYRVGNKKLTDNILNKLRGSAELEKLFDEVAKILGFEKARFAVAGFYDEIGDVFCGGFIGGDAERNANFKENEFGLYEPKTMYMQGVTDRLLNGLEIAKKYSMKEVWDKIATYEVVEKEDGTFTRGGVLGKVFRKGVLYVAINEGSNLMEEAKLVEVTKEVWDSE